MPCKDCQMCSARQGHVTVTGWRSGGHVTCSHRVIRWSGGSQVVMWQSQDGHMVITCLSR